MSQHFENAEKHELGYHQVQVDQLIARARAQFADERQSLITSAELRKTEFDLVRGGYAIAAVDSAIDRLDDALSAIEIAAVLRHHGQDLITNVITDIVNLLLGRSERPRRARFDSTGFLLRGYSRKQVDTLVDLVQEHITDGRQLQLEQVRRVVFKARRGGYREAQVDAYIDKTIELLQLEKNS
jgi:DivIVA domain-containing protein